VPVKSVTWGSRDLEGVVNSEIAKKEEGGHSRKLQSGVFALWMMQKTLKLATSAGFAGKCPRNCARNRVESHPWKCGTDKVREENNMENVTRLQSVARITYYLGWLASALGALSHFGLGSRLDAIHLSQRNLFEASVLFFIICIASELRTSMAARNDIISIAPRRQAA
jgi:hypothetical protein